MNRIKITDVKREANALYSLLREKGLSHSLALAAVIEFVLGFNWAALPNIDTSDDSDAEKKPE